MSYASCAECGNTIYEGPTVELGRREWAHLACYSGPTEPVKPGESSTSTPAAGEKDLGDLVVERLEAMRGRRSTPPQGPNTEAARELAPLLKAQRDFRDSTPGGHQTPPDDPPLEKKDLGDLVVERLEAMRRQPGKIRYSY